MYVVLFVNCDMTMLGCLICVGFGLLCALHCYCGGFVADCLVGVCVRLATLCCFGSCRWC